jgi:hypothetical protein
LHELPPAQIPNLIVRHAHPPVIGVLFSAFNRQLRAISIVRATRGVVCRNI